ncbi:hypothetical protein R1sor_025258 [Riccia sorocarpa]|uniref:Reverse transcriptase domain-containing protein n=1 Tax=Riccia sorocarpa TaxID=122646 RepID=A0ABD3GBD5_9MARC
MEDTFAAVNTYGPAFDDAQPLNLKQIITVIVHKADRFVATAIEQILAPVGKVLLSFIVTQGPNPILKAVTLSSRTNFITEVEVPITPQVSFTLFLDYEGLQLRCRLCLAVSHSAADCPHRIRSPRFDQNREPPRPSERPPHQDSRGFDLNTRPLHSTDGRTRQDQHAAKEANSDSSSTGGSIQLYEQFRASPPSRNRPEASRSISTSTAETSSARYHRHPDSQRALPGTSSSNSERRNTNTRPSTSQDILQLPGLPLNQGIFLQNPSNQTAFNRVYSAYVPPPIAARILTRREPAQMRLTVGTYNVRGLGARIARSKLKVVIQNIKPAIDIFAIQEHKLREVDSDFTIRNIWPQATVFNFPATDGIHAQRNPLVSGGRGGVMLFVSPTVAPLIVNHGTLPQEGGLWLHLDLLDGRKLGIAAVYAPNTAAERTLLWTQMEVVLDETRSWLVLGDFNMITNSLDQAGGTPKLASGEESTRWKTLIQTLHLLDTFQRKDGSINYTWDNRRKAMLTAQQSQQDMVIADGGRILKRLDRIYVDVALQQHQVLSEILPGSTLSDHLPVVAAFILGSHTGHKKTNYRMNISSLQDTRLKEQIVRYWGQWQSKYERCNTPPLLTLKYCIKRAAKLCQLWGKKMATKRKEKLNKLILKVHGLTLQLQADTTNIYTQVKLEAAQSELNILENDKARWVQSHLDRKWEEQGERTSKLFFNSIKTRKKQTGIHVLQDEEERMLTDESDILDLSIRYFSQILQEPPVEDQHLSAVDELLLHTQARVNPEERECLSKNFTTEELHEAAKLLGRNKCPGPDGVPVEFFLIFWEVIAPLLFNATTEGIQQGLLNPFYNRGTITLLPKEGEPTLLGNKRPITLLNSVYKIWAKALQLRLSPILQRLITWEQNSFLPGRLLHSTVLLCNEAVHQAKHNGQPSVLLKLDFRKAFDMLNWEFLYKSMKQMDFGEEFIRMVTALNTNASSSVRINNTRSKTFKISRSVRQGCPLSPLLFTIALQVFSDAINSMIREGQLKGIELPGTGIQYCQGLFADDAHILLYADRTNLLNAKQLLQTFGVASGLRVQWNKSKARWISTSTERPTWTEELDWVWGTEDEVDIFLGFLFTDQLDHNSIFETVKQKIIKNINCPLNRSSTIHGRIVIANHIMYGIIWFILPLWAGGKSMLRTLETLILRYVWGGTDYVKKRHRVSEKLLHQRKEDGGLGLMSLQAQIQAFTAKTIRWAYSPGKHPLKSWLLAKFEDIAQLRWGSSHHTWTVTPSKGLWPAMSPILLHICQVWQQTARFLAPISDLPLLAWKRLSLWGPKTTGARNVTRNANSGNFVRLKSAGLLDIGDITEDGQACLPLQAAANMVLPPPVHRAYARIVDSTPTYTATFCGPSQFATATCNAQTWCIRLSEEAPMNDNAISAVHAKATFLLRDTKLVPTNLRDTPPSAHWSRAPVATHASSKGKTP